MFTLNYMFIYQNNHYVIPVWYDLMMNRQIYHFFYILSIIGNFSIGHRGIFGLIIIFSRIANDKSDWHIKKEKITFTADV